ncbi:hypothetical protein LCGC14_0141590 [marine sediment metagenome]|uniref:HNH nuclease domain-containing protein n=1 Tax=marine sediment metagenome TaxID=412755 RepID=A0A0F9V4K3_9ZZZZ
MEIQILKIHYPNGGIKDCTERLSRTANAIKIKAMQLGVSTYGIQGCKKRLVIEELDNNKVIATCPTHGDVYHYSKNQRFRCIKCEADNFSKWSKKSSSKTKMRASRRIRMRKPIKMYENRLRSSLHHCFVGHVSFTKHLPYSSQELHNHLESIKLKQNNKCPMCSDDYNNTGFDIDHIIPTSSATNDWDMLELFSLKNLSLLCPRCNRFVKRDKMPLDLKEVNKCQ